MTETLRVVLVGPLPPPAGGMANQTRQLAALLRADGHDVCLVQTNAPYRPGWLARVRGLRALGRMLPYGLALWRACARADVMHLMANSGWSWHLFAAPALRVARWRGVPVVVNYRGGGAREFLSRSARRVRAGVQAAAALLVPSGFLKEVFESFGMPARIVPNVVDLGRFSPQPPGALREQHGAPHLVVTRNLEPIYDNATAIRAFALVHQRHPGAGLTIAGTGPERERLLQLAADLGVSSHVRLVGRLDPSAMADLYRSADVMLNASRTDNMPNSVLEAFASGVPVVSTNVGGIPFLVDDGRTGLLVPAGDPEGMAAAVARLVDEPDLHRSLAQAGLQEAGRYTWAKVRPLLMSAYADARVAGQAGGGR